MSSIPKLAELASAVVIVVLWGLLDLWMSWVWGLWREGFPGFDSGV
jgi:hypothetical protein